MFKGANVFLRQGHTHTRTYTDKSLYVPKEKQDRWTETLTVNHGSTDNPLGGGGRCCISWPGNTHLHQACVYECVYKNRCVPARFCVYGVRTVVLTVKLLARSGACTCGGGGGDKCVGPFTRRKSRSSPSFQFTPLTCHSHEG